MTPTDWAAWIGATTGICAIVWDFIKWKSAGPKLKVWTHRNMVLMPDPVSSENRYIEIRVRNNGTAKTTITTCGCHLYDSWFAKMKRRPSKSMVISIPSPAQPLPYKLEVGEEWIGMLLQDEELDAFIATGNFGGAVYHSWSDKPVQVKIRP